MAMVLNRIPSVRVGDVDVTGIVKETAKEAADDDVSGLAAEMTYRTLLALFPFLLVLAGLMSIVDTVFNLPDLQQQIVDRAATVMPEDATSVVEGFTEELLASEGSGAIGFGLLGALWAASSAMGTAMKALDRAYDVTEKRRFVPDLVTRLALTLGFGGLIIGATVLFATGRFMAGGIGEGLGWEDQLVWLWNIATPIVALLMLLVAVALLYWLAPNMKSQFAWVSPGALLFLAAWFAFTLGFAFYLSNFGSYNRVYGSLAAVIILLIWLYWSNLLLLIGAELNAVLARRFDDEYRADPNTEPGRSDNQYRHGAQSR